jgi:plastocyanin
MVHRSSLMLLLVLVVRTAAAEEYFVTVGPGMQFVPSDLTIVQGDTVTWNFVDNNHTTTSDATTGPETWDSGVLNEFDSFSHTFFIAGDYPYHCAVHSSAGGSAMNGTIHVEGFAPPSISGFSPTSGPTTGGTLVTIEGEEFADDCSVAFGALGSPEVFFVNGQTLRAITPAMPAGTVQVSVTCSGGTDVLDGFTFVAAPAASDIPTASQTMLLLLTASLAAAALLMMRQS